MGSRQAIFWDVDTQADFMLPEGRLYVPGAEKLRPKLKRLVDVARRSEVFLISSACAHTPSDEEFEHWPPHCLQGTPGQKKIPETLTENFLVVPNRPEVPLPGDFRGIQQLILEKQALDVFSNPNTEKVLARLGREPEYCVFGVVTEHCVRLASLGLLERGHRVAVVTDAIETLDPAVGRRTLDELVARGARLITTERALALVSGSQAARRAEGPS